MKSKHIVTAVILVAVVVISALLVPLTPTQAFNTPPASATNLHLPQPSGLDNFRPDRVYDNSFWDVTQNDWFFESVRNAFSLSLMDGKENGFDPLGHVTIAEALAMSCRLHNIYHGGDGQFTQGQVWWQVYVDYARENDIYIPAGYSDYSTAQCSRADFVMILASAFPPEALAPINSILSIPDVSLTSIYSAAAYLLYNAGILDGDETGAFQPGSEITRCEAAAILSRLAMTSLRIQNAD